VRAREEREEPKPEREPKAPRPRTAAPPKAGPDPLAAIEAEVERAEAHVARLEEKLAADWTDTETIAAHAAARAELQALLARWERALEEVAGPSS
jgi:hypothetical protein